MKNHFNVQIELSLSGNDCKRFNEIVKAVVVTGVFDFKDEKRIKIS